MLPYRTTTLAAVVIQIALAFPTQDPNEIRTYLARLQERGMSAEVVREGEAWLRANPRGADADVVRYRVGCAQLALGKDAEGARLLEPLAQRADFEFAAECAVRAAEVALRRNDPARAETLLTPIEPNARGATRDSARILIARARLAAGRPAEAAEAARALRRDARAPEVRREAALVEAWAELRASKPDAAERIARTLIDDREASVEEQSEARLVAGEALLDARRPAEALAAFEAVPAGAWRAGALRGAGFALAALNRHAEASRSFATALEAGASGALASECALHVGIEALAAGDAAAATIAFSSKVLDAHPDAAEWRARAAFAAGDADGALAAIDRAAAGSDPDRARRLARLRGEILEKSGRGAEAARAYAQSGSPAGMLEAARASLAAGDARAAFDHAERLLATKPERDLELAGRIALGEAAFRLERWDVARASFEAACALEPDAARVARIRLRSAWSAWRGGAAQDAARSATAAASALEGAEHEEATFLAARALESVKDPGAPAAWRAYLARHGASARSGEAALRLARTVEPVEARTLLVAAAQREADPARAAEIELELGEIESRAKDFAAARAAYQRALRPGAESIEPTVRYGLAFACASLGDDAAAEDALIPLLEASDVDAGLVRAALELAVTLRVRANDGAGALACWQALERAGAPVDRSLAALRPVVPLLVKSEGAADAEKALTALAARARGADGARVEVELGWLAVGARDAQKAQRAVERAGKSGADFAALAELRVALGDVLTEAQDADAARAQYAAAAAEKSPSLDKALVRLAWSRLARNEDAAALADLERFERECTTSPERPRALTLRGEALARLGRHADAVQYLTDARAVVRDPAQRALVLEKLGHELALAEEWRSSADVLAEFAREFPKAAGVPAAELVRGRALAKLGDTRGSRACLERALAAGGVVGARARLERARLARAAGDLDGALSDALKCALLVDDAESTPEALWLASEILTEQGETEAARARLRELVERHPQSPAAERARPALGGGGKSSGSRGGAR